MSAPAATRNAPLLPVTLRTETSRTTTLAGLTNGLGVAWALTMLWVLWRLPEREVVWSLVSLVFPAYYFALSLWLNVRDA